MIKYLISLSLLITLINCDGENKPKGIYELGTPYNSMKFEFKDNYTFTFNEFYDVGGARQTLHGTYKMSGDTIKLYFPDSLFENDILKEYEMYRDWQLLYAGDSIYHYTDSSGVFNRDFPLIKVKD